MRVPARLVSIAGRAFLVVAVGALFGGSFEEQLKCEEAAKHISDCCPGVAATEFGCQLGCGDVPSFSIEQADCLQKLDCGTLRQRGYCAWRASANEPSCP